MVKDSLTRDDLRQRYGSLIGEIFRRANTPTAVAVALKSMGWFGEGGNQYSDRAMNSWKAQDSFPNPIQLMGLALYFEVSIDEHLRGEAIEARFGDRLADQDRRIREIEEKNAWLTDLLVQLAIRTQNDDLIQPRRANGPAATLGRAEVGD